MDPRSSELPQPKEAELGGILERVRESCGGEDGITFIKNAEAGNKPQQAANAMYDELMLKLLDLAEASYDGAVTPSLDSASYESVLRSISIAAIACGSLANDQIPLYRDLHEEARYRRMNDQVSAYVAKGVKIGGVDFEKIEVAIREKRWQKPQGASMRREDSAQPKFAIVLTPKTKPQDEIRIRMDNEGLQWGGKIAYDISVGGREENDRMNGLIFPGLQQRAGHHFDSDIDLRTFGTGFSEVLAAFNQKIGGVARTPVYSERA